MNCPRSLEPVDVEALVSGDHPLLAADAAEHASSCLECGRRLEAFRQLDVWLDGAEPDAFPADLRASIERLRAFSRREAKSLKLWRTPLAVAAALIAGSALLLAVPALSASENLDLLGALAGSFGAEVRVAAAWPVLLWRSLPAAVSSFSALAARERAAAAGAILLLIPLGWWFARLAARRRASR